MLRTRSSSSTTKMVSLPPVTERGSSGGVSDSGVSDLAGR